MNDVATRVMYETAKLYDMGIGEIAGTRRSTHHLRARMAAAVVLRRFLGLSYPDIAKVVRGRPVSHASSWLWCHRGLLMVESDVEFSRECAQIWNAARPSLKSAG